MSPDQVAVISENLQKVQANIARSAQSAGRDLDDVKLVVVTKGHSLETVQAVIAAGATCLGESYLDDALPKLEALNDQELEWHMIGHVQSRKARAVAENFKWVHSVDRVKIARRLSNFASQSGRSVQVLLECNISQEESKFGWPVWDEALWTEFADDLAPVLELPGLEVRGLMTMPPFDPDPENSRPYFEKLVRLRNYLAERYPETAWAELSMGMSGDYEVAVQSGATIVRVGTAIVGPRSYR